VTRREESRHGRPKGSQRRDQTGGGCCRQRNYSSVKRWDQKYGHSSLAVMTNLPFDQWGKVFGGGEVITAAILDRLLDHSEVFAINRPSCRLHGKPDREGAPPSPACPAQEVGQFYDGRGGTLKTESTSGSPSCVGPATSGWPRRTQQNATLTRVAPPSDRVTVTDPTHPFFGLSFPLLGITTKQRLGRVCVVALYPGVERVIPIGATSLASVSVISTPCRLV
jgi:hypothetical protein